MKTTTKIGMVLLGLGTVFTSCTKNETIIPSGNITKSDRTMTGYDGIEIESAIAADVSFSTTEEMIEIEADDNLQQYIEVSINNNVLKVKIKNGINIKGNSTIKVHIITQQEVDYLSASGASLLVVRDSLKTEDAVINASGASNVLGTIIASSVKANLDGASKISLSGTTDDFNLKASGASEFGDFSFSANKGVFNLEGASQANLTLNETISINASGASSLVYKGNASIISSNLTGASQVVKFD